MISSLFLPLYYYLISQAIGIELFILLSYFTAHLITVLEEINFENNF